MGDYKIGQTVQLSDERTGIIRWLGRGGFAAGEWVGVELPDNSGKNDGSVKGERLFECAPGHGLMIRPEAIIAILKQPGPPTRTKPPNGAAAKPRPSNGITADIARRRQTLMGAGSTTGSRLSVRSPTKSPTKAAVSSASSNASTPRTGTPVTTARTSDSSTQSRISTNIRASMGISTNTKPASQASRPSIGGITRKIPPTSRTHPRNTTIEAHAPTGSTASTPSAHEFGGTPVTEAPSISPRIDEEETDDVPEREGLKPSNVSGEQESETFIDPDTTLSPTLSTASRKVAVPRAAAVNSSLESKAASLKEIEQYKAKIRTLERKLIDQREQVKAANALQADKEKLENTMKALTNKLRNTIQAKTHLQTRCDEAEARATEVDRRDGEHDSELEMATLDREMAEEKAEMLASELESLKAEYAEFDLEVQVLREENKELGSVVSPEDKASTGWLQMERERDRLKDALRILRDVTQQKEADLTSQIKELQQDLAGSESLAIKYQENTERLTKSEAANKHLMEQLEAVESNEEVNLALEAEREQKQTLIDRLRDQLQTLQEEAQVSDELEAYHVATEKELQQEVDEHSAVIHEKERNIGEQTKIIEDLEYTLSKFRDVVQGLQSDIDDLRRSRDITESEAHEMSSKSRAMMTLNLQLQNSAAKMQLKTIDIELGRMQAEESAEHLSIIQMFVPDSYEAEKTPVLTFLRLRRIKSKATLISTLLRERIKDRPHLILDDPFSVFDAIERLCWISTCCDRFLQYMSSCRPAELANFRNALHELEPVERTVNVWVESLKRDELSRDGAEMLVRMRGILSDLIEKCIPDNTATAASQLSAHAAMVENYCDSMTGELGILIRLTQSKLGQPAPEDEEAMHFDRKMDQFTIKARTIKYIAGKAFQAFEELRTGSMCVGEPAWVLFGEAEEVAHSLSLLLRDMGVSLLRLFADDGNVASWTWSTVLERMQADLVASAHLPRAREGENEDAMALLAAKLHLLHSKVEELAAKASDIGGAVEFEKEPSPWTVRSKEIKAQKVISQDVQEQLRKLKFQAENQTVTLSEKDVQLEERQIKIELLESRMKETKQNTDSILKLKSEAETLRVGKEAAERDLQQKLRDMQVFTQTHQDERAELESLKRAHLTGGGVAPLGAHDETQLLQLRSEVQLLNSEMLSLQAAVRYLKLDNYRLRVPPATASTKANSYAWLESSPLVRPKGSEATIQLKAESEDVFSGLIDLVKTSKPLVLRARGRDTTTSWRSKKDNPRYIAFQQREELERWHEWKGDLVKRARVLSLEPRSLTRAPPRKRSIEQGIHEVQIVGSPL